MPTVGYRFIGPLTEDRQEVAPPPASPTPVAVVVRRPRAPTLVIGACALLVAAGIWWKMGGDTAVSYPLRVTRVSKLTTYPGDERDPAISPDGSYVAFSWSGAMRRQLRHLRRAGRWPAAAQTDVQDPAPDFFPAWSPDGRHIAFIRRRVPRRR